MFRTTLKAMKRVLSKSDAYMLSALNNFATLLNDALGKHAKAVAMCRGGLAIELQMLGPDIRIR